MLKSRFSDEQAVAMPRESDRDLIAAVAKRHGVSEQSRYTWRKRFGTFHVSCIDPQVRPVALDRSVEEGLHPLVDLLAQAGDLARLHAAHAHCAYHLVDRTRRNALDVGLLDDGHRRLLGHSPGLQDDREVGAVPQLGVAQQDRTGPSLPVAVTVTVALDEPLRALLAASGTGQSANVQLHQPLGGNADRLAKQIGVRCLHLQGLQSNHRIDHQLVSPIRLDLATRTYWRTIDVHPPSRRLPTAPRMVRRERLRYYRRAIPSLGTDR